MCAYIVLKLNVDSSRFWAFDVQTVPPQNAKAVAQKRLQIVPVRTAQMTDDVLCVRYSRDGKVLMLSMYARISV